MAVTVANLALQMLGQAPISALNENSKRAAAMDRCYEIIRQGELERNFWTFAITRTTLAALGTGPTWGRTYAFNLPPDYLRIANEDPSYPSIRTDRLIEGRQILTSDPGPLYLRYVRDFTNAALFHPLFKRGLACSMAIQTCEELTGSSGKLRDIAAQYDKFMSEARMVNAIEAGPEEPEEDSWITVRA